MLPKYFILKVTPLHIPNAKPGTVIQLIGTEMFVLNSLVIAANKTFL